MTDAIRFCVVQVLVKMSLYSPPKLLIENYMVEIARAYNVPFVPDISVMEVRVCSDCIILQFTVKAIAGRRINWRE